MIEPLSSPEAVLDRDCEQRNEPGYLQEVLAGPAHRLMILHRGKTPVDAAGIVYRDGAGAPFPDGTLTIYLGAVLPGRHPRLSQGTPLVLKVLTDDADPSPWVPGDAALSGFRDAAAVLPEADAAIFIQAQAVANWHRTHPRCPRCGAETESVWSGWMRRCVADGSEHFPRTDPAVIVAVVGPEDKILLANNAAWESNRYSTVAGFVEAGENAEQAAVREIAEEVGVHLHTTIYLGSQAWPFPRSLMVGFLAYTDDAVAVPDGREVIGARWFGRAELQAAVLSGEAVISRRQSIARSLIEHWYGGTILEPGEVSTATSAVAAGGGQ
ncbi:NAD(+) diphosphatase [Specibacter sp. RAF43]|uniref:NAD(+) diphosphatase n=1 Tax=Specibacter sp. RAF43 TaxID=3233057 RepID=UPI003F98FEB9